MTGPVPDAGGVILVRYFAAARAAAGVSEQKVTAPTLAALVAEVGDGKPDLTRVLSACTFLVDGLTRHDHQMPLPSGAVVDVLPPFAGG